MGERRTPGGRGILEGDPVLLAADEDGMSGQEIRH